MSGFCFEVGVWIRMTVYRAEKKSLQNIFKQDPGRARQSS